MNRTEQLAEDIRQHVFAVLDAEPDISGEMAGSVAHAVEMAFLVAMVGADIEADTLMGLEDDSHV